MNNQVALTHLQTFGGSWGMLPDGNALVFVDNHDNQRGHGGGGNIITYKDSVVHAIHISHGSLAWQAWLSWSYQFHVER